MPVKVEFGRMELTHDLEPQPAQTMEKSKGSVRIGVIGDFRGRELAPGPGLARTLGTSVGCSRSIVTTSMRSWPVSLPNYRSTLPAAKGTPIVLNFREVDDFHPDRILASAEVFTALRSTRARLENPATFDEAAAQLGLGSRQATPSPANSAATASRERAPRRVARPHSPANGLIGPAVSGRGRSDR